MVQVDVDAAAFGGRRLDKQRLFLPVLFLALRFPSDVFDHGKDDFESHELGNCESDKEDPQSELVICEG